jgi:hypothetical protein
VHNIFLSTLVYKKNHVFNIHTLRRFRWSCDFSPKKFLSTVKQHRRVDPHKEGVFTPSIPYFVIERSSFFKIHGTSPFLKDQEGPTYPLFYFLGQCLFLVFELIRSLLTTNVLLLFDDMCLHKEDDFFFNICMGYIKWPILRCSQYGSS